MKRWDSVDTAKCGTCAVFTPTPELRRYGSELCCVSCWPKKSFVFDDWEPSFRWTAPISRAARFVIATMLLITLAFPLAACVSQL